MKSETKSMILRRAALFGAALIWGSSFIVVKNTVDATPPVLLVAIRFTIACFVLCIVFIKKLKLLTRSYLSSGLVIGLCLFLAYTIQTIGITDTTPGKNAFLTAIYCVLVPFLFWVVNKTRPDRYHFIAAILCMSGIGLTCLQENLKISMGDSLTLLSGLFYAIHIVMVAKLACKKDPIIVTIVQFGYTALFSWLLTLTTTEVSMTSLIKPETIGAIIYLSLFCTAIALLLQNIGQKNTPPAQASIILSLEAVFGVLFSVLFYHEKLTQKLFLGFILIMLSIIVSETKLKFLRIHRINGKTCSKE